MKNSKRIKELLIQAAEYAAAHSKDRIDGFESVMMCHYTELVVRECVGIVVAEQEFAEQNWQCKDGVHVVYKIKEYFGVE